MIEFQPVRDRARAPTLVQQIVDAFTAALAAQTLRPGMAVPSVREFAREYDVSTYTVAQAYQQLVSLGWLSARAGAGYRVAHQGAPRGDTVAAGWELPSLNASWLLSDIFADRSIPIKPGSGWVPDEWLREAGLQSALRHLTRVPVAQLINYGHPYGYAPLRDTIAARLEAHGMSVESSQVLLTQGVTRGLDLVVRTLLAPGDTVVVEQPCYANLLQMLRMSGLRILTVPRTREGLDCEALGRLAAAHRPRAVFVNTVLQNPTGTSMSMANAFRLLQVAERHGMWVIEDDISRELLPGVAPVLGALSGGHRVVSAGGYSKTISPAMRVGYLVGNRDLIRDLARTKMALGLTSPEIMERLVHQVEREGHYRQHILGLRENLAMAHGRVTQLLREHGMDVWAEPKAGLFLWARLAGKWRARGANGLVDAALARGIWLAPGSYFEASEEDTAWMRFNVAYSDDPKLWDFLRESGATTAIERA
ncbi:MAG: PLP-dependent aminotransferase family protein [Comamonadaceae bacterium]|nr:MAG: PLP-dependent aminotransferase family protein [Comamonadaceae bacterium]